MTARASRTRSGASGVRERERKVFDRDRDSLDIKTTGPERPVAKPSGGDRRKLVPAGWPRAAPSLPIRHEPARGIDAGSKSAIHEPIANLAEDGPAVIVISPEMAELAGVGRRILTMTEGRIGGSFTGDGMTEQALTDAVSQPAQRAAEEDIA